MSIESGDKSKSYTFQTDDEKLQSFLDDVDNRSEVLRQGARKMAFEKYGMQLNTPELSEDQETAFGWLLEHTQGETVRFESFKTKIAQLVQLDKDLVKRSIIRPLDRYGYIKVTPHMHHVMVRPLHPSEVESDE